MGRDTEYTQLIAGLRAAVDAARGPLYLVTGAPGIGKTRLVTEVAAAARDAGAMVAWGSSWEGGGAPAFWPWSQVLRALASQAEVEISGELSALVGDLATDDGVGPIEGRAPYALLEPTRAFLTDRSRRLPVVLVFDDLQWADISSLRLLSLVVPHLGGEAVLTLGTVRDSGRSEDRDALLAALERAGTTIELRGLDDAAARCLAEWAAGESIADDTGARIRDATAGNPFFIQELSRQLAREGRLDAATLDDLPLPTGIEQALGSVLQRLDPETVRLLHVASVIGREFSLTVLESVTKAERATTLERLAEAEAHGLVERRTLAAYAFVHDLARRSLLDDLSPVDRAELHHDVGEALERCHAGDARLPLAEIAHHYVEGAAIRGADHAIGWARRAADDAMGRFAPDEAVALHERALEALDLAAPAGDARRCELLIELATSETAAGLTRARDTARRALELAEREGPQLYARAAVALSAARHLFLGERSVLADQEGMRALSRALERLGDDDTRMRVLVLERLVWETTVVGRGQDPLPHGDEAVRLTEGASPADGTRGIALMAKGRALSFHPEVVEERQIVAEELVELGPRTGDPRVEAYGHVARLTEAFEAAHRPAIERSLGDLDALARLTHDPFLLGQAFAGRVALATVDGRLEEAGRLVDEAIERLSAVNAGFTRPLLYHRMYLDREHGRLGEYVDVVDAMLADAAGDQLLEVLACAVHLEVGDEDRGRALYERLATDGFDGVRRDDAFTTALWLLTNACCHLEDVPRAHDLARLWKPFEGRCVIAGWGTGVWVGATSHHLGRLALVVGRHDDARRYLEHAYEAHHRMAAPLWILRTRVETARLRAAMADLDPASVELQRIERSAELSGAAHVARTCRELREAWDGTTAAARPAAQSGSIRRSGDLWTISYDGLEITIKDLKGLAHLRRLLVSAGQEAHVLDLVTPVGDRVPSARADGSVDPGDAGALLDPEAKAAYRQRIEDLRDEIVEAESFGDALRAERARGEIEVIAEQLAAAVGLGGRDRRAASHTERARVNVTRTVRTAIDRIAAVHPSLGHHLATCVRTGTFCVYEPDPVRPVHWDG